MRTAEVSAQPEYFVDILRHLAKALFALAQCRGPLPDRFCERAIPPNQNSDEQEFSQGRRHDGGREKITRHQAGQHS